MLQGDSHRNGVLERRGAFAAILAALLVTSLECVGGRLAPTAWLWAHGVALGFGVAVGAAWAGISWGLRRIPQGRWLWLVLGLTAGWYAASELGAFRNLIGQYANLGKLLLVACMGGGAFMGLILCAFQATRRGPAWVESLPRGALVALLAAMLTLALVCTWVDRNLFVDSYLPGHVALRLVAYLLLMLGSVLMMERLSTLPSKAFAALTAVALVGYALFPDDRRLAAALSSRPYPALALLFARAATDFDRDGYSSLLAQGDCRPFDGGVHPGKREIPGNGIDDNCSLGDASKPAAADLELRTATEPSPVSVILITVDALRRDSLSVYGSSRATTPNLARWSETATVFRRAYTAGGWTSIAVPALLRGYYARRFQWSPVYETNLLRMIIPPAQVAMRDGERVKKLFGFPIQEQRPSLARRLQHRGMSTIAVVNDGRTDVLAANLGFGEGFDVYRNVTDGDQSESPDDDRLTTHEALGALASLPPDRRFLLWVHYFGPHAPATLHPEATYYGDTVVDKYDHEVTYWDLSVAPLLDAIERRTDPIVTVLTADHGEHFEPLGRSHGEVLVDDTLSIPLIVRGPGFTAQRVDHPVSSVDIVPTALALTRAPAPSDLDGIDLANARTSRILLSDTWRFGATSLNLDLAAALDGKGKCVHNRKDNSRSYEGSTDFEALDRALDEYLESTGGTITFREAGSTQKPAPPSPLQPPG